VTTSVLRRRELGAFLRSRRERISPAEAGLPTTGRRRTPGLRREEIALLAGISATWYTYLEQGRDVRPSAQVLEALATALGLGEHERDHLFHLAGDTRAEQADEPEPLAPGVAAVPAMVEPNPAYVTGVRYDVLCYNAAAAELFTGISAMPEPNLARWVFTEPAARQVLVDWEQEAHTVLARLRAAAGRHPDHPRFTRLVDELHAASAEVRAWWPRYDIQISRAGSKRLRHPRLGVITMAHTAFHVADRPEQTLVIYSR
jgi:transcriptional regulator with XRE-family HTH domain